MTYMVWYDIQKIYILGTVKVKLILVKNKVYIHIVSLFAMRHTLRATTIKLSSPLSDCGIGGGGKFGMTSGQVTTLPSSCEDWGCSADVSSDLLVGNIPSNRGFSQMFAAPSSVSILKVSPTAKETLKVLTVAKTILKVSPAAITMQLKFYAFK